MLAAGICLIAVLAVLIPLAERSPARASPATKPNIVFVLTDDLSSNLVTKQIMPTLSALEEKGTVFSHYYVADSLCCPSRATIFTGRFPHDTGVYTNSGPGGGYLSFQAHGDERSTVATDLHAAGYRTAMMGKYLNRYHVTDPIPPGWDVWDVADWGYPEFNYDLNENGSIVHYAGPNDRGKDNYLTDVVSRLGAAFIRRSAQRFPAQPFFLEVATFAPRAPSTPAPRDAHLFADLVYPRTPAFDAPTRHPPAWLRGARPLSPSARAVIEHSYRLRAEDMRSVDRLTANLVGALRATKRLSNTYFVFSSDNGYHMGEHRLDPGKLTAFDTDIEVPLIIVGPRVATHHTAAAFAENVDLRSTFDAWARTHPSEAVDGRSLVPLLAPGGPVIPRNWPQGALIEHKGPVISRRDPDYQTPAAANPPSYEALRLPGALYVEYSDNSREYYDLAHDPWELDNVYGTLSPHRRVALHRRLAAAQRCHSTTSCAAPFLVHK